MRKVLVVVVLLGKKGYAVMRRAKLGQVAATLIPEIESCLEEGVPEGLRGELHCPQKAVRYLPSLELQVQLRRVWPMPGKRSLPTLK